jgi:hypothetical protein
VPALDAGFVFIELGHLLSERGTVQLSIGQCRKLAQVFV